MTDAPERTERMAVGASDRGTTIVPNEFRRHWVSALLLALTVSTIGFGFSGFVQQWTESSRVENRSASDWTIPLYRTIQLLILNSGTEEPDNLHLAIARMLAAATFLLLTATVAMRVFHESTQLPVRMTRTGHTVICGLGEIGTQLLEDLRRTGRARRVVIIERDESHLELDRARRIGADVVIGDAMRAETLRQARAQCAATVFAVTGDDGTNLEIAAGLADLLQRHPQVRRRQRKTYPLRISLHLQDVKLAEAFRTLSRTFPAAALLDLSIFSVARTSATHVVTKQLWPFAPQSTDEVAHFVILGFGTMGRALAVTLARLGHFPNRKRNRFTIADRSIEELSRSFVSRFGRFTAWNKDCVGVTRFDAARDAWSCREESGPAHLAQSDPAAIDYVANAQFREAPPDLSDERFVLDLLQQFHDPAVKMKPVIFVCGQDDRDNFHSAVRLRETINRHGGESVPIFVWLPRQPALSKAIAGQPALIPFGECRHTAGLDEVLHPQREELARAVHEFYEQRAVARGRQSAVTPWSESREDYRESNRQLADHFDLKLAFLGMKLVNDSGRNRSRSASTKLPALDEATKRILAEMEHHRWVAERLMAGWCYTPRPATDEAMAANKERKRHHDLVPWEKLGDDQQIDLDILDAIVTAAQRDRYRLAPLDGS